MAIRSLRRTVFRALSPLQSSSSFTPATQNASPLSLSYYSAEPSTSAIYWRPNFSFNTISCRRFSSLTEEEPRGPAVIDFSSLMSGDEYNKLANSTIHDLLEKLEEYGDSGDIDGFDVDYGNEVLTLKLGDLGTYVINKQTPNRQIWMSSPVSTLMAKDERHKLPSFTSHDRLEKFEFIASELKGIDAIIDSLRRGESWKTLSQKFGSVKFTSMLVANILLQLKEPIDSRKALKFFHWTAKEVKFDHGLSSYCLIIHILVKGGLIKDAKAMFESILAKDCFDGNSQIFVVLDSLMESYRTVDSVPLVFDFFVQTCAKLRIIDGILDACELLFDRGFVLSVITFNTLLHVLQKSGNVDLVWGVYELMIKRRKCPNEATVRIMISTLCKEGKLERFLCIVDRMHGKRSSVPQLIVNTCLIYEMIEKDRIQDGLSLLKHMLQKNMILDTISYSLVVFAKVKLGDLDAAKEIYEEMLKRGFEENSFVCSLFVGAYCDVGRIDEAIRVLEEIERLGFKPSNEAFDHLIKGCSLNGKVDESVEFCKHVMQLGLLPSPLSINVMFEKLCGDGKTKLADEMLTMLLEKGFPADETTFSHLVWGYCRDDDKEGVIKLLCEMEYRSISPNESLSSAIISLCKSGRLKESNGSSLSCS